MIYDYPVIVVRLDEELAAQVQDLPGSDQLDWDAVATIEEAAARLAQRDDGDPAHVLLAISGPQDLPEGWNHGLRSSDRAVKIAIYTRELGEGDQLKMILSGATTVVRPPLPPLDAASLFADSTFLKYLFPAALRGTHREIHELEVPTDKVQVPAVIRLVSSCLDAKGAPNDLVRSLMPLVVDEAVTNAMEHGNEWDPDKTVHVRFEIDHDGFSLRVRDEGPGFQRNEVADPLHKDNLTNEGGRGLFLMEQLMDEVRYEDEGRTIVLRKKLGQPEPAVV